ncbi:MAG: L-histidine N(alpha)-methyltransferase, partial [Acidobacteriaceae bacterium]
MNSISVLDIASAHPSFSAVAGNSAQASAVLEGLSAKQKHLPPWLFYDTAGSRLFEEITQLPEYYLTACEHTIFSGHAAEMLAAAAGPQALPLSVVELGAGSASKTLVLLRSLVARQGSAIYLPVDVSAAALQWAASNVQAELPTVEVQPICAEITQENLLDLPEEGRRLALYIGSSIGNYDPEAAVELLQWLHS